MLMVCREAGCDELTSRRCFVCLNPFCHHHADMITIAFSPETHGLILVCAPCQTCLPSTPPMSAFSSAAWNGPAPESARLSVEDA
jgi:hypothetical protein